MNSSSAAQRDSREFIAGFSAVRAIAVALTYLMHFSWFYAATYLGMDLEGRSLVGAPSVETALTIASYYSLHGVYLFFMVSGFLIGRMWLDEPAPSLKTYLWHRAQRIFPALWAALLLTFIVSHLRGVALPSTPWDIAQNAFLLNWFDPMHSPPWLLVSWSLQVEWLFYLLIPVVTVILRGQSKRVILVRLWMVTALLMLLFKSLGDRYFAYPLFFALGVSAVVMHRRLEGIAKRISLGWIVMALMLIQIGYAMLEPIGAAKPSWQIGPYDLFVLLYTTVGGALFVRVAFAPSRIALSAIIVSLGKISYSFFLWHLLVLTGLFALATNPSLNAVLREVAWPVRWVGLLTLGFALSYAVAWCSYRAFEAPYFEAKKKSMIRATQTN